MWQYCPARSRYVPADFSARPRYTQWDTAFLAEALADNPNQLLVSCLVHGSTTCSDASGLTLMLGPHLTSLRLGFDAVDRNIAGMVRAGKYEASVDRLPFLPLWASPQGTTPKGGPDSGDVRRTSDGGHPHDDPRVPSLIEASRLGLDIRYVVTNITTGTPKLAMVAQSARFRHPA